MRLSELIQQAAKVFTEHGDMDVLDTEYFEIYRTEMVEVKDDDQFPLDWNMPKGTKVFHVLGGD